MPGNNTTASGRPSREHATPANLVCPKCAKVLEHEPNFCPACGADLRGLGGNSDTLDGPLRETLIDGRYKMLEKLGEGGMGAVYKVEHARMGKIAALKLLRPDHAVDKGLKGRFLQEARVVARLSHPNTVQVFDSGELDDGSLFITMEYVPGKDLAWHLKAHGPMSEEKAISVGIQILSSLQEAHEAGIVHRDIKPANVMLVRRRKSGDDQVKLLDFGIAKLQEAEGRKSITGDFVGTPAYMSPEQIRGENIDARSDLYSLGALLFELVVGRQLFDGPTPISIITQHTEAPVPRVADVSPGAHVSAGFEQVLRKALAKKAEDRFQSAEAMRAALEKLRRELGALPNELTPMPSELADKMLSREDFDRFERSLKLQRTLAPVLALLVVAALGVGAWRYVRTHGAEGPRAQEVEPNDLPKDATHIAPGTKVKGAIGAAVAGENDRDLYVADAPGGPVRVVLEGVEDLNLTLEVLQVERDGEKEKLRRRVFVDDVGLGGSERVDGVVLAPGPVYFRVEEKAFCTEANRPSREKALVPYTLLVEPLPGDGLGLEVEPNDTVSTAQPLPLTRAVQAFAGVRLDDLDKLADLRPDAPFSAADWYRVSDDGALVAVVPPERGALAVLDGSALEAWEQKKASAAPNRPAPAAPAPVIVRSAPQLFELKPMADGVRRLRIVAAEDTMPGAPYALAVATPGENGLAGLLDLARTLDEAQRKQTRRLLLEAASARLAASPDAARLTQALTQ